MEGVYRQPPSNLDPPAQILSFLTEDEQKVISEEVKTKLKRAVWDLNKNYQNAVNMRHNDKVIYDQKVIEFEANVKEKTGKAETLQNQLQVERKTTEEYIERYQKSLTEHNVLDNKCQELQKLSSDGKLKVDSLTAERDELQSLIEKRNSEIQKLTEDKETLNEHLKSANSAKIEALTKLDELMSKEIQLNYKEKSLEQESEWISKQVQLLNEQLDKKSMEIIELQRESSTKYVNLQSDLAEKSEQLRIATMQLDGVKETNEELESHIERLMLKLKEAQDVEIKLEENYRQELKSQRRIADLYKETSEEANKRVEELEDTVTNLQEMLKKATDRFGELEHEFKQTKQQLDSEIAEKEVNLREISKELADANHLLTTIRKQGLTDEMIESLSPAAAAACSMLKNTSSLTEIYSKYQALHTELLLVKQEKQKLNDYIHEILSDLQERAPNMQQMKDEHASALLTINALTDQLDVALAAEGENQAEIAHLTKSVKGLDRENGRLKVQIADMSLQVKTLVKEVEQLKGHYSFEDDAPSVPDISDTSMDSSQVISSRLVTFRNIDELQAQNQHLLAVVRELSEAQEKTEKEINEKQLLDLKKSFDEAKKELMDLRDSREKTLAAVTAERDTYAKLLKQPKSPIKMFKPQANASEKAEELEKALEAKETKLKELKADFDEYRKEKAENDRISNDQMEKLRDDVVRMRTENAKLASHTEYNNERARLYSVNLETYKKNIAVLEEKNKILAVTVAKHEDSVSTLHAELMKAEEKLARTEVTLSSMTQERNMLHDIKSRLQAERDLLYRQHTTQKILEINIEEIKNNLEMNSSGAKMKLENEVKALSEELNVYRRKCESDNSRFKDTVLAWDKSNKELQEKLKSDQEELNSSKKELEEAKEVIRSQRSEIEEMLSKINILTGRGQGTGDLASPTSAESQSEILHPMKIALDKKTKEMNLKLIDAQTEIRALKQQLEVVQENLEEYKKLSKSMEDQIDSSKKVSDVVNEELKERLEGKDDIIRDIQARLDLAEKENAQLKAESESIQGEVKGKSEHLEEELTRMKRELQTANSKMIGIIEENCGLKTDLDAEREMCVEMREKFEKEISLKAQEIKSGGEIKSELDSLRRRVAEEEKRRVMAEEALNGAKSSADMQMASLSTELEVMRNNMKELTSLNETLQTQLISLSTQMNSLRHSHETSMNTSFGEISFSEGDPTSSDQWLQLVRYLRREKDIANTKVEMAESAVQRIETQLKFMEKKWEETKKELADFQDKSQVMSITSAKHSDLLRKVETLSALTDSNRMLREENKEAMERNEELKKQIEKVESEIGPLRNKNCEIESKCETLSTENYSLKQEATRWRTRASALIEKNSKINPEEVKKVQVENNALHKQVALLNEQNRKQLAEAAKLKQQITTLTTQLNSTQSGNQNLLAEKKIQEDEKVKVTEEKNKLARELETLRKSVETLNADLNSRREELTKLRTEIIEKDKLVETNVNSVKQIKNIARKYKKEVEELKEAETKRGEKETADAMTFTLDDGIIIPKKEETPSDSKLSEENAKIKQEIETVKSDCSLREDRAKNAMKAVQMKLNNANQQKGVLESELHEFKSKFENLQTELTEASVRFNALKSQYEARNQRLEKENRDLRNDSGSGTLDQNARNAELIQENERLKRELEISTQRTLVLEKQFKIQTQQSKIDKPKIEKPSIEPPKANIKPIAGTSQSMKQNTGQSTSSGSRPPLTASIRPMSLQRKATVTPTGAGIAPTPQSQSVQPVQAQQQQSQQLQQQQLQQPSQQQQQSFVAPVSQAQVSTSTPDQSTVGGVDELQVLPPTSTSTSMVTNSTNVRQATVQPTPAVTIATTLSATIGTGTVTPSHTVAPQSTPQASSNERESTSSTTLSHEDPSTSSTHGNVREEMEMGDSSEQVSSSEPSSHQPMTAVAPIRSNVQDEVQQSSSAKGPSSAPNINRGNLEEPSPSTSTSIRPSTSGKRGRDNEAETSQEEILEPESKRTRINIPYSVDREAEPMAHQQEHDVEHEREFDHEADQGQSQSYDELEEQEPHSDTSDLKQMASAGVEVEGSRRLDDDDDDDDVIVIESDSEDDGGAEQVQMQYRQAMRKQAQMDDEDEEDDDELDEEIEEEVEEEEVEDDDDGEDDDENEDGAFPIGEDNEEEDEGLDYPMSLEGREAESLDDMGNQDRESSSLGRLSDHSETRTQSQRDDELEEQSLIELERNQPSESNQIEDLLEVPSSLNVTSGSPHSVSGVSRPMGQLRTLGNQRVAPFRQSHFHQFGDEVMAYGDDSIVPSTPILFVPRRNDGFAEAVSSPQLPTQGRFIFNSQTDTPTPSGSSATLEDTRVDFQMIQYDDGTGRSVPTTPLQISPPAETGELDQIEHGEHEMSDIQPSSSNNVARSHGSVEIPAITITSVLDSSSGDVMNAVRDMIEGRTELHLPQVQESQTSEGFSGSVSMPGGRFESSVTSSDEDKLDGASSAPQQQQILQQQNQQQQQQQQPTTSSSFRTLSPTPSSGGQGGGDAPPPQQHRVRPTPIVWDQPTSSSSSSGGLAPPGRPGRGGGRGGLISRPNPILSNTIPDPGPQVFRQLTRGVSQSQSARRSRPHSRGGPITRGFGKGPY